MMRLIDLVGACLSENLQQIVFIETDGPDLRPYLQTQRHIPVVRLPVSDVAAATGGVRSLVVATAGPAFGSLDDVKSALADLAPGTFVALALGWTVGELPVNVVLQALGSGRLQSLVCSELDYTRLHVGLLAVRTELPLLPLDRMGRPLRGDSIESPAGPESWIRVANELALLNLQSSQLRQQLHRLELASPVARQQAQQPAESTRQLEREKAAALKAAERAEAAVRSLERKVHSLETSTSLRLGQMLVDAGRKPQSELARLPRQLARLWRGRAAPRPHRPERTQQAPPMPTSQVSSVNLVGMLTKDTTLTPKPRGRLCVAGVLSPTTARVLARHADLIILHRGSARGLVERTHPDVVLIETRASTSNPGWLGFTEPGNVHAAREVLDLINEARVQGRPVALWRNGSTSAEAGASYLEPLCDEILVGPGSARAGRQWSPGVDLHQAVPVAPDVRRSGCISTGSWNARESSAAQGLRRRALIAAVSRGARLYPDLEDWYDDDLWPSELLDCVARPLDPKERAEVHQQAAVAVTAPFTVPSATGALHHRALEQLASGLRVVSGPNSELEAAFPQFVRFAQEQSVEHDVLSAVDEGAPTASEAREVLRVLFERHSAPVLVAQLAQLLGIHRPTTNRRSICVVADVAAGQTTRLVSTLANQRLRPDELVVHYVDPLPDRALDELIGQGVRVHHQQHQQQGAGSSSAPARIPSLETPWICLWDGTEWPSTRLLDLAIGAEISEADAVGLQAAEGSRFCQNLPGRGSLLRASVAAARGIPSEQDLADWARQGERLYGFTEVGASEGAGAA